MNLNITNILTDAVERGVSDIFIIAGLPITFKINGVNQSYTDFCITPEESEELISAIYANANRRDLHTVREKGDDDFSFALKGVSRFRVSTYKQRGTLAAVIRIITFQLPNPSDLRIPDAVLSLAQRNKGLVLVTGTAGSGKSTTLSCMVDYINRTRAAHIITLEDPLEYLHSHKKSIVSQREINTDTESFVTALRASLRQSPDVILLGEMRDYDTMNIAMTAAETGHLILSSLHTIGAANTVDRIVDSFPANQQRQICIQLAMILQAVVSQQLIPSVNGTMIPAFEIMTVTPAIRNMIRENKVHQINNVIYSSSEENMVSMDTSLLRLYKNGEITAETALEYATNPELLSKKLV